MMDTWTRRSRIEWLERALLERVLVLDGAMGTMIQQAGLGESDYRGVEFAEWSMDLKGNNDLLSMTQPDLIKDIHMQYLDAGATIIETNTFNSNEPGLADYGMSDLVSRINRESAVLAREACKHFETDVAPRIVAGVLGPTNRTASISPKVEDPSFRNVSFDELKETYAEATRALIAGGADLIFVETVFDTLNAKAALVAIDEVSETLEDPIRIMIPEPLLTLQAEPYQGKLMKHFGTALSMQNPSP